MKGRAKKSEQEEAPAIPPRSFGGFEEAADDGAAKYRVVDLFSGAGGFTLGFVQTNRFKPVLANDFDKWSAKTYRTNFGAHCVVGDLEKLLADDGFRFPAADVVIGGPPCQGFSLLNKKRLRDPRKGLWRAYMEVVRRVRPSVFVMENVPELLKSPQFEEIKKAAEDLGYEIVAAVLNAADYGVPQRRRRVIIVASRVGTPRLPDPTHRDPEKPVQLFDGDRVPWETVERAVGDLPRPEGTEIRRVDPPLDLHFGRNPTRKSRLRYKAVPEGGNRVDLLRNRPDLTPDCWIRKKSGGTDLFGRLWRGRPAFTIRTEFYKPEKGRYLHPTQHRPITHREAARLQRFPDAFRFVGTKIEIAKQIGNAVPPLLGKRIAEVVAEILDAAKPRRAGARFRAAERLIAAE